MWSRIYYYFFPGSVYDQEERFLQKNGYPEESVTFVDSTGRISQIIGKKTLLKNIELLDKIKLKNNL